MKQEVRRHFKKVDPILFRAIEQVGELEDIAPQKSSEYFNSLCREIVAQQLGSGAVHAIVGRFNNLFPQKKPKPSYIVAIQEEELRKCGMSWAKARYIKDLAQKVITREVVLSKLSSLSDEEVIIELTKIKGIGPWTAEMFLMFSLGREDVFSFGDLGLKNAMKKLYGQKKQEPIVARWSPYRSWASRILWKLVDG
ncbi:DNA-3-methyladenine glycosylase 2 family protein [Patescibacteria group bacterium]|nr:DNA-3-methyladenine glycosylase 2 family protein [Patescibacteria group bacterium]